MTSQRAIYVMTLVLLLTTPATPSPTPNASETSIARCEEVGFGAVVAQLVASQSALQARLQSMEAQLQVNTQKLQDTEQELQDTKQLLQDQTPTAGSAFVRWGRMSCPGNTTMAYTGVAGGKYYAHTGTAANRLCLTMSPQFDNTPVPVGYGQLYGGEYEYIGSHLDHDVPCAVCLTPLPVTVMIPATLTCPAGWTKQYSGHLTSERDSHASASEFVCLDGSPEDLNSGVTNDNGSLFYFVVTRCGSLPCPPYINDKIVTCVVCSK